MVDFTNTHAQAKEVVPPASREGGQTKATAAKPLSSSPPLTVDGVDKMYHQLLEIHIIVVVQLVECARWRRSNTTPSPVQARTGR
jgi:hypothetical protein